jgi:hypothetical protein
MKGNFSALAVKRIRDKSKHDPPYMDMDMDSCIRLRKCRKEMQRNFLKTLESTFINRFIDVYGDGVGAMEWCGSTS